MLRIPSSHHEHIYDIHILVVGSDETQIDRIYFTWMHILIKHITRNVDVGEYYRVHGMICSRIGVFSNFDRIVDANARRAIPLYSILSLAPKPWQKRRRWRYDRIGKQSFVSWRNRNSILHRYETCALSTYTRTCFQFLLVCLFNWNVHYFYYSWFLKEKFPVNWMPRRRTHINWIYQKHAEYFGMAMWERY